MSKTLQEQMLEAIDNAIDENVDAGGDFRNNGHLNTIHTGAVSCTKIAQRYALEQQIKMLKSLSIDYYDEKEGLGGTYGDNYVGMDQISVLIGQLEKQLEELNGK